MKRLFSGLLALCLCLSLLPTSIPAQAETEGYLSYRVSNGEAWITDCDSSVYGELIIPDTLGGYPVRGIDEEAFCDCSSLEYLTIPEGVTDIGAKAFYFCSYLTLISLPDSLLRIGEQAFADCNALIDVHIPAGVTSIGTRAFAGCRGLIQITVSNENPYYSSDSVALYSKDYSTLIQVPAGLTGYYSISDFVKEIGPYAFYFCNDLTDVRIPNGVTAIGEYAFYGCYNLTGIVIPGSVQSIGEWAFYSCDGITGVEFCDGVTHIGANAFRACSNLRNLTIPDSVCSIGDEAFSYCYALTHANIGKGLSDLGYTVFRECKNLENITVSADNPYYTADDRGVLYNKDKTTLIQMPRTYSGFYTIPNTVTRVEGYALDHCYDAIIQSIPASVTYIGEWAFAACRLLGSVTISGNGVIIGERAFWDCNDITTVTLGDGVTSIGEWAFYHCDQLTSVTVGSGATQIDDGAFLACASLKAITVSGKNPAYSSDSSGVLFNKNQTTLIQAPGDITGAYRMPETVTVIGSEAFYYSTNLTGVTLPNNLTHIGESAFYSCTGLTELTIPGSVTAIDNYAFRGCTGLKAVTFCGDAPSMKTYTFGSWSSDEKVNADVTYYSCTQGWTDEVKENYGGVLAWTEQEHHAQYRSNGDATCTDDGTKTGTCLACGNTVTVADPGTALGHSYADRTCIRCGAADPNAIVAPTLTLKYPALTFEDVITMNVLFSAENIQNVTEMGLITYKSQVPEWNVDNAEAVISGYALDAATGFYVVSTQGIAAKDMGDTYWFAVYAKLTDGTYTYTELVSYSPVTYAKNVLSDPAMGKLVTAMLNYGAAAQTYFGHNTDSLVNAGLTAEQLADLEPYRADMMDDISTPSAEKAANFTRTAAGFISRYPTVTFDGAFCIDYFCQPSGTPVGDITLYYWDQTAYDACDVLSVDNATGALTMVKNGDQYATSVEGIAAKDLDKGIYVAFVYSDGTNTYCSGILGYSIGAYCVSLASGSDAMAAFAQATAIYGYYAKQAFGA